MLETTPTSAAVSHARQLFFEKGTLPSGLVQDTVWRSWQRCAEYGRKTGEAIVFNSLKRHETAALLERNRQLIKASEAVMLRLAKAMNGTGYNIILTDHAGVCIANGPSEHCGNRILQAFRPGVDLSEQAIGTNAMTAAMAESRPVGIFGPEHFFAQNQNFQCVAAPIFDPEGVLLGSIDISRDSPAPQLPFGALSLMRDCAAAIETSLLLQMPAHLSVSLNWRAETTGRFSAAILAFGKDGEILAVSRSARRLLGIGADQGDFHYRDLFHGSYAQFLDAIKTSNQPAQLTLQSGLPLFAQPLLFKQSDSATDRAESSGANGNINVNVNVNVKKIIVPEFGDADVQISLKQSVRALGAGLPILILGETGTGKEVAARALHASSAAADGPFIAINCGAIPRELIEGELFGYADGAYTGARRGGAKGKIEEANGGTLFLDEIGDMPLDLQTRLLRVLESREVTRLGESVTRKLNIQIVSATHQDLDALVREQRFRADLYYRINGILLSLPPLRKRNNLSVLIATLLREEGIDAARLTPETAAVLTSYGWPGNTRELRTALRFAKAMAEEQEPILLEHLPDALRCLRKELATNPARPSAQSQGSHKQLKTLAGEVINDALREADGNISCAARQLGISRSTLHRWLNKNHFIKTP